MTPTRATASGRRAGPGWPGLVVAGMVLALVIAAVVLIVNGTIPVTSRRPVQVDITLPQPILPDTPALPDGPIVPPVDPRVASGTGTAAVN